MAAVSAVSEEFNERKPEGKAPVGCWKKVILWEPEPGESVPLHLIFKNRYFRAAVYMLMCIGCTLIYYGWQAFSRMLFRHGAYRWQCEGELLDGPDAYCTAQYNSVQALFTIGLSCEFIFGVLAGVLLDFIGPWFTGLLGCIMFFGGWMCLLYSSASVQAYVPGMALLTGSINLVAFPCLSIGDSFPSHQGLMISMVVAAQTASTMIAPICKAIWDAHPSWEFSTLIWGYLLFIFAPFGILYLLCLPWKRVVKKTGDSDAATHTEAVAGSADSCSIELKDVGGADEGLEGSSGQVNMSVGVSSQGVENVSKKRAFFRQLLSCEYLVFTLYYVMQVMMYGYYPTTVLDEYGEDVSNFQGYVLPSQAVFGIVFGLFVDKVKTLPFCVGITSSMTFAMFLALIRNTKLQYFTSVLYVISNSYIYTVKYTYVAELYPTDFFGVLIGIIGCVAGAMGLINVPVQNLNNYVGTCIAYVVVGFCCFVCIAFCWYRQKKGYTYITPKPSNAVPRS